jgi:protein-tyrosine phosphatase
VIDIHCHILPGIDDGAPDIEESAEMLRTAAHNNIQAVIATPHFTDFERIDEFLYNRDEAIESFEDMLESVEHKVAVTYGAEVFLNSKVFTAGELDGLTLGKSRYMLCEYTLKPFDSERAVIYAEEILGRGHIPIIAHPERYITFAQNPEIVNELWDMGCMFQVNASSLAGHGGEEMQEFTEALILKGFADFVATDAHSHRRRNNRILDKIEEFPESISDGMLRHLLEEAPMRVLKDEIFPEKEVEYF